MPDLKGVEIFAVGKWNGNIIEQQTLSNLIEAFEATKEHFKPVLKLGHNDEQELLKADGLPAAGWVTNLRVMGQKLVADFIDIPKKIFELIKKGAYKKVSVEIFRGYTFKNRTFPDLLGAVALLGADTPAVLTLNDILERYSQNEQKTNFDVKLFYGDLAGYQKDTKELQYSISYQSTGSEPMQKEEATVKNDELSEVKATLEALKKERENLSKEYESYKKKTGEQIADLELSRHKASVEKELERLAGNHLVSPSMRPFVAQFLDSARQSYSLGEKNYSGSELLEEILKLAKETFKINLKQVTSDEKPEGLLDEDMALEKGIDTYLKEHTGVSYSQAYRDVRASMIKRA